MEIADLGEILGMTAQTAVSIYAPNNKTYPDNKSDITVLENKVVAGLVETKNHNSLVTRANYYMKKNRPISWTRGCQVEYCYQTFSLKVRHC